MAVYSAKGMFIEWNNAAERIFGYRENEVIGMNADFLVPKDKREEYDTLKKN